MIPYLVAKEDERYRLVDFEIPEIEPLTVSLTELKEGKSTRGHSHPSPEVYIFLTDAILELMAVEYSTKKLVREGQMVLIQPNEFHRVWSKEGTPARFVSVFPGKRSERKATYGQEAGE